jgi:hypothetical protein
MDVPKVNTTPPVVTPPVDNTHKFVEKAKGFKGKIPCFWSITQNEDNTISASNGDTNETFEGTLEEFNARLRG